jgi:type IV secretory pathway TrbD component
MEMSNRHTVYRSLNRPLTILGVERRLFFLSALTGGATFNLFGSLLGGLMMFGSLYAVMRFVTRKDPQMLRILLSSGQFKNRYDPAQRSSA